MKDILEGDNINLTCAFYGLPKPQLSWFKDNRLLREENSNATLVKRNITEEEEGTYTCVAMNEGGSANDRIVIIVYGKRERNASVFMIDRNIIS